MELFLLTKRRNTSVTAVHFLFQELKELACIHVHCCISSEQLVKEKIKIQEKNNLSNLALLDNRVTPGSGQNQRPVSQIF